MVGEHNPTAAGAFQAGTEFRNLGMVHFKPELNLETTPWVSIRTYHYDPPRPPQPLSHRRVLDQNAIDTWNVMVKRGWRPCRAPAR